MHVDQKLWGEAVGLISHSFTVLLALSNCPEVIGITVVLYKYNVVEISGAKPHIFVFMHLYTNV